MADTVYEAQEPFTKEKNNSLSIYSCWCHTKACKLHCTSLLLSSSLSDTNFLNPLNHYLSSITTTSPNHCNHCHHYHHHHHHHYTPNQWFSSLTTLLSPLISSLLTNIINSYQEYIIEGVSYCLYWADAWARISWKSCSVLPPYTRCMNILSQMTWVWSITSEVESTVEGAARGRYWGRNQ